MRTATDRGLLIIISFSLMVSIFASAGIIGDVQASGPTYTTHSPIRINNNGDLAALRTSGGSTGSGLVGDPYVINGYDITGTGGTCIYIGNTTRYLVISDCRLHGNNASIELVGASYVTVSNNICSGNAVYGIHTSAASHNVIEGNTITGAGRDNMFFQDSNNNIIQNNTSTGSGHCSNWLSNSNNNTYSNNTSSGTFAGCGLQVQSSDYNTITNSTLTGNAEFGIRVFSTSNHNIVVHNLCENNQLSGIGLSAATNNSLSYNICTGNTVYGIAAQDTSSGNYIYGNEITRNNGASSSFNASHYQAYDNRTNHWNSVSYGNFWGDWTAPDANHDGIVDRPYPIAGSGAKDYLPTVSCQGLNLTIAGPSQAVKGENVTWSFQLSNNGKATAKNVTVLDPLLNKTWSLGDVASGASLHWSYQSAVASYQAITNNAYATATDVYGGSYNASSSHSITVLLPPSAPQGLTATIQGGHAVLSWNAPTGASITDYRIFRGPAPGSETYLAHTGDGSVRTFNDSGIIAGQTYYYQVSAVSSAGEGARSSEAAAIPSGSPTAPRNLQATPGNGQVVLAWSAPASDGGEAVDYYIVYQNGVDVMHVTSTSTTISGLVNGIWYNFTVAAHNQVGQGARSSIATATPSPDKTVPGVPRVLIVTPGNAQASLSWTAPANNGGASVDHYIVYQDGVDVAHPVASSIIITGLVNGQSYNFTVAAHNSVGPGVKTSAVAVSPSSSGAVPGIPTGLITKSIDGGVGLSWTAPQGSSGLDYYVVYQDGVDVTHTSDNSTTITGLNSGQNYTFEVAAHNSYGMGNMSSAQTASPSSPSGATTPARDDGTAYFLGAVVLLAAVIVIVLMVRRRGKGH